MSEPSCDAMGPTSDCASRCRCVEVGCGRKIMDSLLENFDVGPDPSDLASATDPNEPIAELGAFVVWAGK